MGLLAVFVLALQFFTGLYLFVLPFATKWGSGRRTEGRGGQPHDDEVQTPSLCHPDRRRSSRKR
jgi:hypothetical protein